MTYNIYTYAAEILKKRKEHYDEESRNAISHTVKQCALSEASAYDSAWWILYYAMHENWDALEQFDYFKN